MTCSEAQAGVVGDPSECLGAGSGNEWDFQCCTSEGKPKPEGPWRSWAAQASIVGDTSEHQILPRAVGGRVGGGQHEGETRARRRGEECTLDIRSRKKDRYLRQMQGGSLGSWKMTLSQRMRRLVEETVDNMRDGRDWNLQA